MLDDRGIVHCGVKAIVEILELRIFFGGGVPFGARRLLSALIGRPGHVAPDCFVNSGRSLIAELRQVGRGEEQAWLTKIRLRLCGDAYLEFSEVDQKELRTAQRRPFHPAILVDSHELGGGWGLKIRK